MHIYGICSVLCLLISIVIDESEAECDEYFVVFEEYICPDGKNYKVTPLKRENITWDDVTYPCNSTVEDFGKECLVEFNYNSTEVYCPSRINVKNTQSHSFTTGIHSPNPITVTTETPEVTTNKLTEVTEIPHRELDDKFTVSIYDINIHFINKNSIRNDSKTTSETTKNKTLNCINAEIVCLDELKPENESLSSVKNTANNTHLEEHASKLLISIDRDKNSPVQPIFTGYFPELSNDSPNNYNSNFEPMNTMSTSCSIPKHNICKENFQINIYFEANYIKNNTITKYPNCTLESITSEDGIKVKCEDVLFAKHNSHIAQTVQKQRVLICQVKDLKYTKLSSSDQNNENNNLHFINCSNYNKIKTRDSNITPTSNSKNITINSILSNGGIGMISTEAPVGINKDNSSQENPKNMVTIFITENTNNCSQNIPLNIDEGKIIDLGVNKKDIFLQNNDIDLILSNCINYNSSIINDKQPTSKAELTIVLKNESLNASNLEQFNGSPRDKSVKQKILLQCNHHNHDSSSNATNNKTKLQCESIDLEFYNITGIYITPSIQISNNKTTNKSENEIKQKLLNYCQILELNDTSNEHRKRNIYFKNCSKDIHINNSKNNSDNKNIERIFDGENKYTKDEFNKTENSNGKFNLNKPSPPPKSKNMIKIVITEIPNNCSHHSSFIIDEGKIVDLDVNANPDKILQNNIIDLKLSKCIDVNFSVINETHTGLNVDLTIIMKNESLNVANLQLFNGTAKNESIKQRILLRCQYSNLDSSRNITSDKTALHCESIDLDLYNITGIETSTEGNQSITNINKELIKENVDVLKVIGNTTIKNVRMDRNGKLSANNKSLENNTKLLEKKGNQKNISETNGSHEINKKKEENNENQKTLSKKQEISTNLVFNRKKDIPNVAGQNSLGQSGSPQSEKTVLIILLAAVGAGILMVLAWRVWPKKKEYSQAPTREPPNEEETAF